MSRAGERFAKLCCLIGTHFIIAPYSFMWVYGNLIQYVDSYVRYSRFSQHCNDGDTQWILPLYAACQCPGLFLVHPLVKRVGLKWTSFLTMVTFNAALLASSWTIQLSVVGTVVLQGVVMGMGASMSMCISYMYINAWKPKYEAVLVASVSCAANLLAMVENQAVTELVNPSNIQPDRIDGQKTYFSQSQVLERVPNAIRMLGGITLGLQVVGLILVTSPPTQEQNLSSTTRHYRHHQHRDSSGEKEHVSIRQCPQQISVSDSTKLIQKAANRDSSSNNHMYTPSDHTHPAAINGKSLDVERNADKVNSDIRSEAQSVSVVLTPAEIIRTSSFWALWFSWGGLTVGLMLKNCFYKQFGLLYIRDDKLLTLLGTFTPLVTSIARVALGFCIDKHILSVKGSLILGLSSSSVLCAFWYLAPQVSGVLYAVVILCLSSVLGVFYVAFPTAIMRMYSSAHFSSVLAMLDTAASVVGLSVAVLTTPMLQALGWFWIFASGSFLNLVILALVAATKLET